MVRYSRDGFFSVLVYVFLGVFGFCCIFPVLYVCVVSITPYEEVLRNGGFVVIPRSVTWEAYREIFKASAIPRAFSVNVFVTGVGTLLNLAFTTLMAYPLSRKSLPGRKMLLFIIIFPMLFGGGLIPTYLIVKATGVYNSLWAMIVPSLVASFNLIIIKTFFEGIEEALFESAKIDGAGELRVLVQIILPVSLPVLMTVGLYYGVGHWNTFFAAIFYITDQSKFPLQVVLRNIIDVATSMEAEATIPSQTIKMAAVVVVALPIVVVYPFIQKYFVKGTLLGAVKG